jgi:hypothetical protein
MNHNNSKIIKCIGFIVAAALFAAGIVLFCLPLVELRTAEVSYNGFQAAFNKDFGSAYFFMIFISCVLGIVLSAVYLFTRLFDGTEFFVFIMLLVLAGMGILLLALYLNASGGAVLEKWIIMNDGQFTSVYPAEIAVMSVAAAISFAGVIFSAFTVNKKG